MLKKWLFLVFLVCISVVRAQVDTLPVNILIGFGGGVPFFQPVGEQDYAVDAITQSRDHSTQLHFGVQFNKNSKNKFELYFKRTRFSLDETELNTVFENRYPDAYYYPQYTVPNRGYRPYFNVNCLNVNYGREFRNSKVRVLPYVGIGAGLWWQKNFIFMLRDKDSNFGTEYLIRLKKNVRPVYSLGVRFGINKFPLVHLDLSIHGGSNEYTYNVVERPQDPSQAELNASVSYNRMIQSVNLVLVFSMY